MARMKSAWLFVITILSTLTLTCVIGAAQPVRGGTLVMGLIAEPAVLDSCSGAWNVAPFAGNIMSSILATDENMKIVPGGVAESWSIDARNKTYTFNLRKGIKW